MFERQRHTQENSGVPHYAEILEFIDLRARGSEMVLHNVPKCHSQTEHSKSSSRTGRLMWLALTQPAYCAVLGSTHPLYVCRKFKSGSLEQHMNLVRKHLPCFNFLQSGHLRSNVLPTRSAKNVASHTILRCTHSSSAMAWLRQLVEKQMNHCRLK